VIQYPINKEMCTVSAVSPTPVYPVGKNTGTKNALLLQSDQPVQTERQGKLQHNAELLFDPMSSKGPN
jgi:hypothetical protein